MDTKLFSHILKKFDAMPNRIDINFDEKGYADALKAANDVVALINGYVRDVKPSERAGGQSMGDGLGWVYAQRAFQVLSADRSIVHPIVVNFDAFARDIDAATKLLAIRKAFGNWVGNMEGTFILLGKDLMEQSNRVLDALKVLATESSTYQSPLDDLNFLYENRSQRAAATIEQQKRIEELERQVADGKSGNKPA